RVVLLFKPRYYFVTQSIGVLFGTVKMGSSGARRLRLFAWGSCPEPARCFVRQRSPRFPAQFVRNLRFRASSDIRILDIRVSDLPRSQAARNKTPWFLPRFRP